MKSITLKLAVISLLSMPPFALACPEKVPAGLKAVSVAEAVAVNSVNVGILQVQGRDKAAVVLARVAKEWTEAGYAVKTNTAMGWNVVSAMSEKCMTTLQLVDQPGAFGYLAVNRFEKGFAVRLPKAPVPSGAQVLSNVASDDDGRKGLTTVLSSGQSVDQLVNFYKQQLEADQWSGVRAVSLMGQDRQPARAAVSAQRGRERIEVVIVRDAPSKVVVNVATQL